MTPDKRPCVCGHKKYDHIGRCNEGTHRCGCLQFRECTHPETTPWRTRQVCTVCNQVMETA